MTEAPKLKIALVVEQMEPGLGGRETSSAQIACELARRGHQVTVLCRKGSWSGGGVQVHSLRGGGLLRVSRLRRFLAAVQEEIAGGAYDIVHAMLPVPGANVYQPRGGTVPAQQAASFRRRRGPSRWARELLESCNLCRGLMAQLERRVTADPRTLCLAVSEMVAMEFDQYYGRTERVRVVYNGVEVPDPDLPERPEWRRRRRQELGLDEDALVFLTVARNFELKGVAETIAAFARWYDSHGRRTKACLVVVGREMPEGYMAHAGMRSVGSDVTFIAPTAEIFEWYAAADAVVLLSWYDPCSRVILEATRWGIPSVTTVYNGAAEVLGNGGGVVVESPRDIRAVTLALADLADPQRRAARAEACRRAGEDLSVQRHVDELLSAYAEILQGR
jgi:UDP-glucose:(heptosyl)LPS alpha-1,3-glucosyltransferase